MENVGDVTLIRRDRIERLRSECAFLRRATLRDRALNVDFVAAYARPDADASDRILLLRTIRDVAYLVAFTGGAAVRVDFGDALSRFVTNLVRDATATGSPLLIRGALNGINLVESIGFTANPIALEAAHRWVQEPTLVALSDLEARQRLLAAIAYNLPARQPRIGDREMGPESARVLDRLITRIVDRAPVEEVLPFWHDLLLYLPLDEQRIDIGSVLWIARLIHVRNAGQAVSTAGDFLKRSLDELLDLPAP